MRRLILSFLLVCATGFIALAQTNFRSISFDEALKVAESEGKMVFIDFYTDWCGPCKKMAREVFPQKKVGDYFNSNFVNLKLNAEKEGKELATRFHVKAYPTFLILDTTGKILSELRGAMDADIFISKIENSLNSELSPERMAERYQAGERTPQLVNNYALYLMEQRKEGEGFKIVDEYFNSLSVEERLGAENLFLFTRYTQDINDPKAVFMTEHRNDFKASAREAVMERIAQLYNSKLTTYYSGYMRAEGKYVEEEYQALKKQLNELGLTEKYNYIPMFHLIEGRMSANNDMEFLNLCDKEFNNLSESAQNLLIMNLSRLTSSKEEDALRAISKFVRSKLHTLSPITITMAGRMLESIESGIKPRAKQNEKEEM